MKTSTPNKEAELGDESSWLEVVRQQVNSLRFGVVQIVVHESRVVQIATSIAAGVNWYLNKNIKLTADYEQSEFDGGSKNGVAANGEKVIFTRVQFAF